jgi:branched-subunit amino acid transport protein
MSDLLIVVIIGIGTYAIRVSFIAALGTRPISPTLARPLKYVAPAVLAALLVPAVVLADGSPDLAPLSNPKFVAAVVAGLVAWRTRSVAATILGGMGVLWVLQAIG